MAIIVQCKYCGNSARLPNKEEGQMVLCTACGRVFRPRIVQPSVQPWTEIPLDQDAMAPGQRSAPLPRRGVLRQLRSVVVTMVVAALVIWGGYAAWQLYRVHDAGDLQKRGDASVNRTPTANAPSADPAASAPDAPAPETPAPASPSAPPVPPPVVAVAPPPEPQIAVPAHPPGPVIPPQPENAPTVVRGRPAIRSTPDPENELTDARIIQAIGRGVDSLIRQFDQNTYELSDGMPPPGAAQRNALHDGVDVLCVYALMQCGDALTDEHHNLLDKRLSLTGPFMTGCINAMKRFPLDDQYGTYSRGLRATALAMKSRKEDQLTLRNDVADLLKIETHGAFYYYKQAKTNPTAWDNSNSQYGLLGIWSGAEADPPVEINTSFWHEAEQHWQSSEISQGGGAGQWPYQNGSGGSLTMTCAGLASLFVCHDYLHASENGISVGRNLLYSIYLDRGLNWLETGDNSVRLNGRWGYSLYGVERVGLASGFKFFGTHEWYPELVREVLRNQHRDGSWGQTEDDAYALLFLSRGQHPILMNKARFEGTWANRPRDVANLARFASRNFEYPVNWQVVPLTVGWTHWMDSPILYIASHTKPTISDDEVDKIRHYVQAGKMLFVQADGGYPSMVEFAIELGHRLFPMYRMVDVPANHPLFTTSFAKLDKAGLPPLKMLTNGSRILMLFSTTDMSRYWQVRDQKSSAGQAAFQLGINMYIYAAGPRDMRKRLETTYIPPTNGTPSMTVNVARIQYAGNWDPEPYAWTRFARWFQKKTGYALDVKAVSFPDLDPKKFPFAHLTGVAAYNATADEAAAVKKYVEGGGVLLVDLTGGMGPFDTSFRNSILNVAFPGAKPDRVTSTHPLLSPGPSGMEDVTGSDETNGHVLRQYAIQRAVRKDGNIEILHMGKGHVIFTSLDVTSGLLNTGTWGIVGFESAYSQKLVNNAILWTLDGQTDR